MVNNVLKRNRSCDQVNLPKSLYKKIYKPETLKKIMSSQVPSKQTKRSPSKVAQLEEKPLRPILKLQQPEDVEDFDYRAYLDFKPAYSP